ncbi:MAG: chitinase [Lachnospiraceae bacterium]|nr:chitinase [Lachnospiraceae bacterium]
MSRENDIRKKKRRKQTGSERQKGPDRETLRDFRNKVIAFLVTILLIVVIIAIAFGSRIKAAMQAEGGFGLHTVMAVLYPEKYSYSTQMANLNEYFQLFSDGDVAIILQDERINSRAKLLNEHIYFSSDTVSDLFTDRFYINDEENVLLYTTADDIYRVAIGKDSNSYSTNLDGVVNFGYPIAVRANDGTLYIAADYVKLFANFSYDFYSEPNRMQVYTQWGSDRVAQVNADTQVRYQGGIKSNVLRAISAGESVEVLETMENWTKVKTDDCFIGYIENNKLSEYTDVVRTPVTDAYDPVADYSGKSIRADEPIFLGFHQIGVTDDGTALEKVTEGKNGINVVSPTWYYLRDSDGSYLDNGTASYVNAAHAKGYKVWALLEDMTNEFDEYELFSSSENRKNLIDNLINSLTTVGADGINVDLEKIDTKTGPHYVQFLRELSIETRKNGLVLSVDDYAPNEGNRYYNYKEQGLVADYVMLMQYNEHWNGSDAGSVASAVFVEKGIDNTVALGVPAEKIVSILPFYTRIWKVEGSETSSDAVGMDLASAFAVNHSIELVWDDELCQNYGEVTEGSAKYMVWIEDEASMKAKLGIVEGKGVAGVGGWRLGLESEGTWDWFTAALSSGQ